MENCGFNHEFKRVVGNLWRCAQCDKVIYREEKENVEPNLRSLPKAPGEVFPKSSEMAKREGKAERLESFAPMTRTRFACNVFARKRKA